MSFIDFQSLTELKKVRNQEREERQIILDKAREKYEKKLKREKEARERGETTWMLPSVEEKINSSEKKKKKKRKKEKKEKKEKKSKKKKKKEQSSSSSSSESENEEKSKEKKAAVWTEKSSTEPTPKREEWMEVSSLFKTQTREQIKIAEGSSRALKKLEERVRKEEVNKPGSHARELNPYYKDGGVGLPSTEKVPSSNAVKTSSYDAAWLRRALQRAKEQATEEGKTLEEVAAARWGSLDTFYKLLNEAEGETNLESKDNEMSSDLDKNSIKTAREKGNEIRDRRDRDRYDYKAKRRRSRSRSKDRSSKSRGCRSRRSKSTERNKRKDVSRNMDNGSSIKRSSDRSRSRDRKRKSSSDSNSSSSSSSRNRNRHRNSRSSSNSSSSDARKKSSYKRKQGKPQRQNEERSRKLQMRKPAESDDDMATRTHKSLLLKPDDSMDYSSDSHQRTMNSVKKNTSGSWRKKMDNNSEIISQPKIISSSKSSVNSSKSSVNSSKSSDSSSSSESDSDDQEKTNEIEKSDPKEPEIKVPLLTDKEMNQLGAKLTKAELLGNTELVEKLKSKLEAARNAREKYGEQSAGSGQNEETREEDNVVILTRTDRTGFTRPVTASTSDDRGKKKKKKPEMYADGKRASYFEDDFRVDLQSMFEKEKTTTAEDQIAALANMPHYTSEKLSDDFDVDDMFIAKVAPKESGEKERERDMKKAIWEHQRSQKVLDSCHFCIDNKLMKKHLIVALGKKCYVSLPYHQSLTEGHCMIVPHNHVPCGTQADEDLWEEIMSFQQALVRMFSSNDEDCIFFETATKLHQTPHMVLQCIPLPKETGDLAPIYFKKAILDCDEEWAQNKKLVDLKGRNVRKAVPKGLPYFYVDFGMTPGFAHVIENERLFPNNFAQEIIGGMIDADYSLFRKPKSENFDQQRRKVLAFGKLFQPFDPTENN